MFSQLDGHFDLWSSASRYESSVDIKNQNELNQLKIWIRNEPVEEQIWKNDSVPVNLVRSLSCPTIGVSNMLRL